MFNQVEHQRSNCEPSSVGNRTGSGDFSDSRNSVLNDCDEHSISNNFYSILGKRAFDIIFTLMILPIVLPSLLLLLAVVAVEGGLPLYAHVRVGKNGRQFKCLKIRTMARDSDEKLAELLTKDPDAVAEWKHHRKLKNDPRVTRIGKLFRTTGLDELPQFVNILRGDMSLVGPRPMTSDELFDYATAGYSARDYKTVRPGLTGLWQINGRRTSDFGDRIIQDRRYISNISFARDLNIILRTVLEVLYAKGQ